MAITYDSVIQQILSELGAVKGATATEADSNFTAPPTTATVIGPDFVPSQVQPALAGAIGEIVEAIASTPLNPERAGFTSQTATLASGDLIPRTDSGGTNVVIGVIGTVRDSSDSKVLIETDVDKVRSWVEFSSTVYSGFIPAWYAVKGQRIYHTRTGAVIDVCTYTRPTVFTGNISLDDWHESGLVQGAVAKLALKESMFSELFQGANTAWQAHLAQIRNYGNPEGYGKSQAAPSSI